MDQPFNEILAEVNKEVERRIAMMKHWTTLAPKDHSNKHRSYFIDKRNRAKDSAVDWQDVREIESGDTYAEWLGRQGMSDEDAAAFEPPTANPDVLMGEEDINVNG